MKVVVPLWGSMEFMYTILSLIYSRATWRYISNFNDFGRTSRHRNFILMNLNLSKISVTGVFF